MSKGETLRKWRAAHQYRLVVDLNRDSEADAPIIERLEAQPNKARYVKGLIRRDIDATAEG